jgi:hypothetical protein
MINAEEFIKLVRSNGADMDAQLKDIYNKNIRDHIIRAYERADFFHKRQRDFAKKQSAKFWAEFSELRERVTKLGYFGVYLDEVCLEIYTNELDPIPFVAQKLKEREERQLNYANQPKKTPQEDNQISLF